jgi:hypothetical protein
MNYSNTLSELFYNITQNFQRQNNFINNFEYNFNYSNPNPNPNSNSNSNSNHYLNQNINQNTNQNTNDYPFGQHLINNILRPQIHNRPIFTEQTSLSTLFLYGVSNLMQNAIHELSENIVEEILNNNDDDNNNNNDDNSNLDRNLNLSKFLIISYKDMPNKNDHENCSICFDNYMDDSIILGTECIHFFHKDCMKKWLNASVRHTCPICRTDL